MRDNKIEDLVVQLLVVAQLRHSSVLAMSGASCALVIWLTT